MNIVAHHHAEVLVSSAVKRAFIPDLGLFAVLCQLPPDTLKNVKELTLILPDFIQNARPRCLYLLMNNTCSFCGFSFLGGVVYTMHGEAICSSRCLMQASVGSREVHRSFGF